MDVNRWVDVVIPVGTVCPALCMALCLFAVGHVEAVAGSTETLERGRELVLAGKLHDAIVLLEEAQHGRSDDQPTRDLLVRTYKLIGIECYGENHLEEAVSYWRKAAAMEPGDQEILGYIARAESEIRNLERLRTPSVQRQPPSASQPLTRSSSPSGQQQVPGSAPGESPERVGAARLLRAGLAMGPALSQSTSETEHGTGWHFAGYLTGTPRAWPVSLRLSARYLESSGTQKTALADTPKQQFSLAGIDAGALARIWHVSRSELFVSGGIGVYRVGRTVYDGQADNDTFHRKTAAGYLLGIGWMHSIGSIELSAELHHLNVQWLPFPTMWLLTVSIKSR